MKRIDRIFAMNDISQDGVERQPKRRSIGTLLIWAVNLPLLAALALLLPLDYQREMEDAIVAKHAALEEEAMTIYEGLIALGQKGGRESAQKYINSVCTRMQESRSPGHHIVVRWNHHVLQADAHHAASPEIIRAMQEASVSSDHRAAVNDESLVVGTFSGDGVEVQVSEYTTNIRRSIRREILLHLAWLAGLAVVAAAIVNVVLWRIMTRPVKRLSNAVMRIANGDYEVNANDFHCREMNDLSNAVEQMSKILADDERNRRVQMDRARRIQEHLLPNGVEVPGLRIAHLYQPADEVAGDYYDFLRLSDDTWLICVADVAGHGISAAMGSAMLKALVLHAAEQHREPSKILQFMNERLPALLCDEFITMFLARWNPQGGRLDYASAGHEPGLLLSPSGDLRKLPATGLPLGVDPTDNWQSEVIFLVPGERLLLTTDGVAETSAPGGELFGRERLLNVLLNGDKQSPRKTVTAIRTKLLGHRTGGKGADDVTILLLEVNGGEPSDEVVARESEQDASTETCLQPHTLMRSSESNDYPDQMSNGDVQIK
ncbi:PP2C family protein-serine/threonine phosphatase [Aeoliella sp.]|uniref:PP2C family protein-serine/threonine phosphatase n=1 Tax=Aeoliella sp. TaxID=2795800 RepID=UPI003CCBBA2B